MIVGEHKRLVVEHIELVGELGRIELVGVLGHIELVGLVVGHIELVGRVVQRLVREQVVFQLLGIQLFLEHVQLGRIRCINLGRLGEYIQLDVQLDSNQSPFFLWGRIQLFGLLRIRFLIFHKEHIQFWILP